MAGIVQYRACLVEHYLPAPKKTQISLSFVNIKMIENNSDFTLAKENISIKDQIIAIELGSTF